MRRGLLAAGGGAMLLVAGLVMLVMGSIAEQSDRQSIPQLPVDLEISNAEFGALIEALSEPEGYFDTDNFITNETSYLHAIEVLEASVSPGGVYLGVGPDQNFSYIVHTNPSIAIVTDIRRQNMLQHLLFKVLIEQAQDRLDYLCTLLARNCPEVPDGLRFPEWLRAIGQAPVSQVVLDAAIVRVRDTLTEVYGLELDPADLERLEYVHRAFAEAGLSMRFSSFSRGSAGYPTFEEVLLEQDRNGEFQNYLARDEFFERLQKFQAQNRLIPVVGDFAGSEAMPAIARFLTDHSLEVSVFYVSNVEFYLAGSPEWDRWVGNLRQIPFRPDAVFVRAYFPTGWPVHPQNVAGHRPTSLVQGVAGFLDDAEEPGRWTYWDVVTRHLQ